MKLLVIGSSNMDLVINVAHLPQKGETILGGTSATIMGGKGANQAIAAKRAGGAIGFITKIGKDSYGETIKSHFIKEGLPDNLILTDANLATGIAQIMVSEKGENIIAVAPGANGNLNKDDIDQLKSYIQNADFVLLQLEIPIETVNHIINIAFENNKKVILNPAPAQKISEEILERIWLLTPNETEAELLTGIAITDLESATNNAKQLLKNGVKNVIITLGSEGALFATAEQVQHYKGFPQNAVDTTAAGDVFNGVLAFYLSNGATFDKAILQANAAASISVTRKGAQTSIPDAREIEVFVNNL